MGRQVYDLMRVGVGWPGRKGQEHLALKEESSGKVFKLQKPRKSESVLTGALKLPHRCPWQAGQDVTNRRLANGVSSDLVSPT